MLRTLRFKTLSLALLFAFATLVPTAAAAVDEYPAPGVDPQDDSIVIYYNWCPLLSFEGCRGPYKVAEVPVSTDPCAYAPTAPGLCRDPCPSIPPAVPVVCGRGLPSTDPCDHAPTAPVVCKDPCASPTSTMRTVCNGLECVQTGWNCPDLCGNNALRAACECIEDADCPDPCDSVPSNVPIVCGGGPAPGPCDLAPTAPGLCKDPCPSIPPAVPVVCGRGLPSTDPCDHAPTAPVVCKDPCASPTSTMRTVCNGLECVQTGWNCPDACANNALRNACECVEDGDCPDPCDSVPSSVPIVCGGGPAPGPCDVEPGTPVLCGGEVHPPVDVDGQLCVYRQNLDGSNRQLVKCVVVP